MPRETTTRALYRRAIDRFGPTDQTLKAIEEMGELTQALCKHLQALTDGTSMEAQERMRRHIAEEMADVVIMLDQLSDIYQNRAEVLDWKTRKHARLRERLDMLDRMDAARAEAEARSHG